jgi:23S rRNA (uracil1939-C5)-methyltransferase
MAALRPGRAIVEGNRMTKKPAPRRRGAAKTETRPSGRVVEVTVEDLGARGDGLASGSRGRLFVPYAAPGDRLRVALGARVGDGWRAEIVERLEDGPDYRKPPCWQFGACGGCAVQQLAISAYESWKRGLALEALARRGLDDGVVGPLRRVPDSARRRARIQAVGAKGGAALGFFAPQSHRIVPLDGCIILKPEILRLRAPLGRLLTHMLEPGERAEAAVTVTEGGLDVTLGLAKDPDLAARESLTEFGVIADLARLSWRPMGRGAGPAEPLFQDRAPKVMFGPVSAIPPPDAFLQPTVEGEALLRDAVTAAVKGAARIADLYAGCGAFGLPLAQAGARVTAADSAGDHIRALLGAARAGGFGERIEADARDLERRPLAGPELAVFDAVVLDPPRGGAEAQCRALADSSVPVIAYVSCHAANFARDARILVDGGYALESVTPVDQFTWTPHLELVGVFRRG